MNERLNKNQEKKPEIKLDIYKICNWIDRFFEKTFGSKFIEETCNGNLKCKSFWGWIILIIILIILGVGILGFVVGGHKLVVYCKENVFNKGGVEEETNILQCEITRTIAESDFQDDKWTECLGSFLRDSQDLNYFALNSTKERALLKFHKIFSQEQTINFEFVPRSKEAINTVININDLYEIVIGDDDYETITLKARKYSGEPFQEIKDRDGYLRKKLEPGIKKDTPIRVSLKTECYTDGSYSAQIILQYEPNIISADGLFSFPTSYDFSTVPHICKPLDIRVGLINEKGSFIASEFISFTIQETEDCSRED